MQGYIVGWNGMKTKVIAQSPKNAAHRLLLETLHPSRFASKFIVVYEQETEDAEVTAHVFNIADRKCAACGCTEQKACPGGCEWVDWDLCTACNAKAA
jgi:hypothetical protein